MIWNTFARRLAPGGRHHQHQREPAIHGSAFVFPLFIGGAVDATARGGTELTAGIPAAPRVDDK
jgi:hypothetical protein